LWCCGFSKYRNLIFECFNTKRRLHKLHIYLSQKENKETSKPGTYEEA
jgi:hypothetical protein